MKTPLDKLILNPNWKENFEKNLEKQKNCRHKYYTVIDHHPRPGLIGDMTEGHSICIKCHKWINEIGYPSKEELQKKMIFGKFRTRFE